MSTTCRHCIEMLLEYVDGQLPEDVSHQLDSHIADCEPCENFVSTYKATPKVCREAFADKMPDHVAEQLSAFIHAELKKSSGTKG